MKESIFYSDSVRGETAETDFSVFLPSGDVPSPSGIISDYLVAGPFVAQTDGAFETEYFYQREKILSIDYLESIGGESNAVPFVGNCVKNRYLGRDMLDWKLLRTNSGHLTLGHTDEGYCKEIFITEQRNAVFYVATYIRCDSDCNAVICYDNSGSHLFVNGELVDDKPYGRVKGLSTYGYASAVSFHEGMNLIMFKIRGGYICDGIDFSVYHTTIYPIAIKQGNLGVTYPKTAFAHIGTREEPQQIMHAFAGAFGGDVQPCRLDVSTSAGMQSHNVPALAEHSCEFLRLSVPVGNGSAELCYTVPDGTSLKVSVETQPLIEYDGVQHLFSDFHFDTTYHQEQRAYAMGAFHITKSMLQQLDRDSRFKAVLSEIDYLHPFYSIYPEYRDIMRSAFRDARAEADCFYNQPNELTSSPEGFVRNLVYGQLYHRDVLGRITPVYAPGDVFGHPNQMSQICAKGGCIAAKWGKIVWGLDDVFFHVSPDGTKFLHDKGCSDSTAVRLGLKNCHWYRQNGTVTTFPCNDDLAWTESTVSKARYSVFSELMSGMLKDIKAQEQTEQGTTVDTTSRDLTQHHSGVLLTRTDFKQANRLAENLLISAEKFAALAAVFGAKYPEKALDKAWRQLLCAQHHDSITGTNNEISFVDLMIEYREAATLAADILNRSTSFIASGIDLPEGGVPYVVFNPHTWDRVEPCGICVPDGIDANGYSLYDPDDREFTLSPAEDGKAYFIPDVPALGYCVYMLRPAKRELSVPKAKNNYTIENDYFRITVDPKVGGGIVSLFDKLEKREVIKEGSDGPANRVVVLREVNERIEEQHELYTTGHKLFSSDYEAEITVERTPVFEKLHIAVQLDTVAKIRQEITLWDDVPRIDMRCIVEDYQSKDDLFTVTFSVNVNGAKPVYDDRFAPHVCGTGRKKLSFQTHQFLSFSHSRIMPVNQWFDLGPTVRATLSRGRLPLGSFNVGMTALIRSASPELVRIGEKLTVALSKKAIPVTPYPDGEQHGGHKIINFNEDLDNADTRIVLSVKGVANEYEKKLMSRLNASQWSNFINRCSEDGKAALYFSDSDNIYKKPIDVLLLKARSANELEEWVNQICDMLETGRGFALKNVTAMSELPKIDDYGVAIFNNGTISSSVEPDNLMNMMLFHTANFYGNIGKTTGGEQLVPEQKTHSFSYALFPHSGSYREAELYRRALEFNDPLFACVPEEKRSAVLQSRRSFVESSDGFVITSFKAGGYPAASMKDIDESIYERGLALRGFEIDGVKTQAEFDFGFRIDGVSKTNLLEEEPQSVDYTAYGFSDSIGAHSIETYKLTLGDNPEKIGFAVLGAEHEEVEPTYVRSWEHDLGSMPMGYLSVCGVIGKNVEQLSDTQYVFPVSVVNNFTNRDICGTMELILPDGFTADRTHFDYSLKAGESSVFKVTVTKPSASADGLLRLNYEFDGQHFEDVFEFGRHDPSMLLSISDGKINVKVNNFTDVMLTGELAIATPFETWELSGFNREALGSVGKRTLRVELAPGESKTYSFDFDFRNKDILNSFWAVAKLMMNGRIYFAYGAQKGPRHNHWAHILHDVILRDDNGSIERILNM